MRRYLLLATLALSSTALGDGYKGPARPTIPSDGRPLRTVPAECIADVKEVTAWDAAETKKAADTVCDLRTKHGAARKRLLDDLAKLVATFKDVTNHDHAANLPATIKSVQTIVQQCVAALESQQYCHNIACLTLPEDNAIFCENQAAALVERIAP
jgi:hypothetical protein